MVLDVSNGYRRLKREKGVRLVVSTKFSLGLEDSRLTQDGRDQLPSGDSQLTFAQRSNGCTYHIWRRLGLG